MPVYLNEVRAFGQNEALENGSHSSYHIKWYPRLKNSNSMVSTHKPAELYVSSEYLPSELVQKFNHICEEIIDWHKENTE